MFLFKTDDISNLSPAIISSSNLIYLSTSLTAWEHVVESIFAQFSSNEDYVELKQEFLKKLTLIKAEFTLKPLNYADVLPVTFESKIKLVLAILRVI